MPSRFWHTRAFFGYLGANFVFLVCALHTLVFNGSLSNSHQMFIGTGLNPSKLFPCIDLDPNTFVSLISTGRASVEHDLCSDSSGGRLGIHHQFMRDQTFLVSPRLCLRLINSSM